MIRQIERANDQQESIRIALQAFALGFWVCLPGIVKSYDSTKGTVTVLPAVEALMTQTDGTQVWTQMKQISNIPVIYSGGGAAVTTYSIQPGDEALVHFSDRCIDGWWQSGQVQPQAELRMHSLSDGFAEVGPRSLPRMIPNISTTTAQFRSLDGTTYVEIAPGGVVNIVAPGGINIHGPLNVTGDVQVTGTVTGTKDAVFNGHSVSNHVHSGVQTGGSDTGTAVG